jgi:hypothetical protein
MRKAVVFGLALIGAGMLAARGDIIPSLDSITGSSPNFTWNYTANVTVNETVNHGDFFTIYDFSSIMPTVHSEPTGWTFSTSLMGPTPANVTPHDDPTLWNITWAFSGTTPLVGSAVLGTFSVGAGTNQTKLGQFASQATRSSDGTQINNIGNVSVPVPEPSALLPIVVVCAAAVSSTLLRRQRA